MYLDHSLFVYFKGYTMWHLLINLWSYTVFSKWVINRTHMTRCHLAAKQNILLHSVSKIGHHFKIAFIIRQFWRRKNWRSHAKRPPSIIDRLLKNELVKKTPSVVQFILLCYFWMLYIEEVSFWLLEVLYAFLKLESL